MVIAGLIGIGFAVLLIAPTVHRRINMRSRETAEASRVARAEALQSSSDGQTSTFDAASDAISVRDRLLLRGVRSEVVSQSGKIALIYKASDAETVSVVMDELGIG